MAGKVSKCKIDTKRVHGLWWCGAHAILFGSIVEKPESCHVSMERESSAEIAAMYAAGAEAGGRDDAARAARDIEEAIRARDTTGKPGLDYGEYYGNQGVALEYGIVFLLPGKCRRITPDEYRAHRDVWRKKLKL